MIQIINSKPYRPVPELDERHLPLPHQFAEVSQGHAQTLCCVPLGEVCRAILGTNGSILPIKAAAFAAGIYHCIRLWFHRALRHTTLKRHDRRKLYTLSGGYKEKERHRTLAPWVPACFHGQVGLDHAGCLPSRPRP
ncbi:MAG: hypothetical protein NTY53_23715 [Kiritimatiellaeota bacterium]|nr:hypothetical protein [Kiritimatiellota bacterium]